MADRRVVDLAWNVVVFILFLFHRFLTHLSAVVELDEKLFRIVGGKLLGLLLRDHVLAVE